MPDPGCTLEEWRRMYPQAPIADREQALILLVECAALPVSDHSPVMSEAALLAECRGFDPSGQFADQEFLTAIRSGAVLEPCDGGYRLKPIDERSCCNDVTIFDGDLLKQRVDVIVNAWNRNPLPWFLLLPSGVSGAIKREAGLAPFRELARMPLLPLGAAVATGPGRLPFKAIIHVAGINLLWRASDRSIRLSVRNAVALANQRGFDSMAFPAIGAGSGGFDRERAIEIMRDELAQCETKPAVIIVRQADSTGAGRK